MNLPLKGNRPQDPKYESYSKQLIAGQASMKEVAPAFATKGIKVMDLIKAFNEHPICKQYAGKPVTAVVKIDPKSKTFIFEVLAPATSYLLKEALGKKSASKTPGRSTIGTLTAQQVYEIAKIKQSDMPNSSLRGAYNTVAGTARSSGIAITGEFPG